MTDDDELRSITIPETAYELAGHYTHWGEHPDYPSAQWRDEVAGEETRQGYWDWVAARLEEEIGD